MAFERITLATSKAKAPAGLTITQLGKSVVALRKDLVTQAGFKADMKFAILLGTDDDYGKLRIVKDRAGAACARELVKTGAFFFSLGMLPAVGVTPHKQRPTEARLIENGVEIDIPEDAGPKLLAPPAKTAELESAATAAAGGGARKGNAGDELFLNGITIDLTDESESITFDGDTVAVSALEARLVAILARPRPSTVAENFIIKNLWPANPPKTAVEQLRQLCVGDLKKGLASIGLNLNAVKGVGYQLKDA